MMFDPVLEYGRAVGEDIHDAMTIAAVEANETGVRQRVALCPCPSNGRRPKHFSYRPVDAPQEVPA